MKVYNAGEMSPEDQSKEGRLATARKIIKEVPNSSSASTELRLSFRNYIRELAPSVSNILAHSQSQSGNFSEKDLVDMDFGKRSEELGKQLHDLGITSDEIIWEIIDVLTIETNSNTPPTLSREIAFFIAGQLGFSADSKEEIT